VNDVIFGKCYVIGAREKKEKEDTLLESFVASIYDRKPMKICKFAAR